MPAYVVIRPPASPEASTDSTTGSSVSAFTSAFGSAAVAITSRSLTESAQPPQRAGDLDALGAGHGAQRVDDLLGDRLRAREQHARRGRPVEAGGELLEQLLLDLRAEAAQPAQLLLLGGRAQRLERVDPELVVEPARALRTEPRQVHHRDQPARELRAQLLRLRRVAGLDQRLELVLERLADARPAR